MESRNATKNDSKDIFDWRNDPITRKSFFNHSVINWTEHQQSFEYKLSDESCILVIVEENLSKLGVVRYDKKDKFYSVSLNTNPLFRRKGLSSKILLCSENILKEKEKQTEINAEILNDNSNSKKTFLKAGYKIKIEGKEFSTYVKFI